MFDFILFYLYSFFYLNVGRNLFFFDRCMFTFLYNNKNCKWLRRCFRCMAATTKHSWYHINQEDAPLLCAGITCLSHMCAHPQYPPTPLFFDALSPSTCFWPLVGESETTPALQRPPCENTMYRTQHTRASVLCFYDAHVSQCEHACPPKVTRRVGIVQSIGVSSLPSTIDARRPRLLYFWVWSLPREIQGFSFSEDESGLKQEVMKFWKGEGKPRFWATTLAGDWMRMMRMCRSPGAATYVM